MCIEMCIEFILELANAPLLLVLLLVVSFPSPLQKLPNVFIPQPFSDSYVTALVILLQRGHTADGAA